MVWLTTRREAREVEEGVLRDGLLDGVEGALVGLGPLPFDVLAGHGGKWLKDVCALLLVAFVIID